MIEQIIKSDKAHPINLYKELLYPYLDDEQEVFSPLLVGITNSNPKYKITRPPIHRDFSIEYVYEGKALSNTVTTCLKQNMMRLFCTQIQHTIIIPTLNSRGKNMVYGSRIFDCRFAFRI